MPAFELHPQLARDTVPVHAAHDLALLLVNDRRYPWLLLVPQVADVREWHDLPAAMRERLFHTSVRLGEQLLAVFGGDKLNVAMIGNRVSQCHLHHVVRFHDDASWPDPVWGRGQAEPYPRDALAERLAMLRDSLDFCRD